MSIVFLVLTGCLSFTVMDFLIQHLLQTYSVFQVSFFNSLFTTVFVVLLIPVILGRRQVKIKNWKIHLLRGCLIAVMDLSAFYSYADNPIPAAYSLVLTGPLWASIFDWLLARQKSSRFMWLASLFSFAGVIVVLNPTYQGAQITLLFALLSAIVDGVCIFVYRHHGSQETTTSFILTGSITTSLVLCPLWLWQRTPYTWGDLGISALSGFLLAFATFLVLYCFRKKEVLLVGSLQYSQILWAVIINFAVYGLWPTSQVLIGGSMVATGGILLVWRSSRKKNIPPIPPMVERI